MRSNNDLPPNVPPPDLLPSGVHDHRDPVGHLPPACTRRGSLLRKIAWGMMKQVSGLKLEDITSGFRVYNRKAIRELASWRATFLDYQDIGVLLLLQSKNIVVADVEVPMQARRNGKSRVFHSWLTVIYYMSHTLLLGLSKRSMASRHRSRSVKS